MNMIQRREALLVKLKVIKTITVLQGHASNDSVGITFDYLDMTYTAYLDAQTEKGDLLRHDTENITKTEYIGDVFADDLINFFTELPKLETIAK